MWRRQSHASTTTLTKAPMQTGFAGQAKTREDLLRSSQWEQLDTNQHAQQMALFALPDATAFVEKEATAQLNAWVATKITPKFQPDVVDGIINWLTMTPDDAHLFVGGERALGYSALTTAVVQQQLAGWPTPVSYCYVPDPNDLLNPILITVPLTTGSDYIGALKAAIATVSGKWDDANNREVMLAQQWGTLKDATPATAQGYIENLRTALLALATADAPLPWDDDNEPPLYFVDVEPEVTSGAPVVDSTLKPDQLSKLLLRANGGVLVIADADVDVGDLITLLRAGAITIKEGWPTVPFKVRVALLGSEDEYQSEQSALFNMTFRYEVWCQDMIAWTPDIEATYSAYAEGVSRRYSLPSITPSAVGRLLQESGRRVGGLNRSRVGTDIVMLHDLIVEAGKIARSRNAVAISGVDVDAALAKRRQLQRQNIQWVREAILSGESITPTAGSAIGQINGLGIYEMHPWEGMFAVPMRISATVKAGRDEQVLDIEQGADQADSSHVRGVLTMEGYLNHHYGQKEPLSLVTRIRFEQEHGGTGGDSASAAQLFAVVSALAELPIRSSIAVTGAIGQYGEMQPIGGINTKIEGFWELCNVRRLLDDQPKESYGVIMPATNARDLMLRGDVADSIANDGWFSVWLIDSVEDAMPILMGQPIATIQKRVEDRLHQFYLQSLQQGRR